MLVVVPPGATLVQGDKAEVLIKTQPRANHLFLFDFSSLEEKNKNP